MPTLVSSGDARIDELVRRIVEGFAPLRVILFGSRARGDNRPDSDVDLLVVVPDEVNRREVAIRMYGAAGELDVAPDFVVVRESTIRKSDGLAGSAYYDALREGAMLYDRA